MAWPGVRVHSANHRPPTNPDGPLYVNVEEGAVTVSFQQGK